jgi:glycosyltransferase involved in cell wall biosynthesis
MTTKIKHITVAAYTHPELYPPVLSAIDELALNSERIDVITRNMLVSKWRYPSNVRMNYINDKNYTGFGIEKIPMWMKLYHFLRFIFKIRKMMKSHNSEILIVHDVIPLFAAFLLRKQLKKQRITLWYHNHDVTDMSKAGKYSLMGIAAKFESKAFSHIDIFTLPSQERLQYFPIEKLAYPPTILPNYPLKRFYQKAEIVKKRSSKQILKLVFQGSIGAGHGLEELIGILKTQINDKQLELHLVGKVRESYLKEMEDLVAQHGVGDYFYYHGMKPFAELPVFLSQFDVGLAIHKPYNVTYSTGGTASNKIYEYAACSFPVILFDNTHYRDYLDNYKWTYFTDLSKESLIDTMTTIDDSYDLSSEAAKADFNQFFNFETVFKNTILPILDTKL